ncbi:MAG: class IV adenylate cyclase [Candidatus Thermoplasmatota archaeon]|nr:class IV adenylate cyclase [Candidatus Thermoplasmatota archaeon]
MRVLEVEAKAHLDEPERVISNIIELGGREIYFTVQRDTYYRHPGRDFALTDEALRIREEEGRSFITYKGPKLDTETKSREELEVPLVDPKDLGMLLLRLGFEPVAVVEKRRRGYLLGTLEVCVDEVKGLGHFLEVEARGCEDLEEGKTRVLGLLDTLGLERRERLSYLELLLERGID